jgi:succinyldiaminopimelate transaminase
VSTAPPQGPGPATPAFEPPVYPYERLWGARQLAEAHEGGVVDLSIGTPGDPPPPEVVAALSSSNAERGYPASVGSARYREAAAGWMQRRLGAGMDPAEVYACVGTKEFVTTLPHWLRLRRPDRDTVLYPSVSYPSYAMGATLAGCRAVAVPVDQSWRLDLSGVELADAARALCLWVNTPGNPAGQLDDLGAAASWGRAHGVPVFSDECYVEFTWQGDRRTVLEHGREGVVALHSLSKRSNLAGLRAGFYAGDAELTRYLSEVRKHVGMLVPGPVQAAGAVALDDDAHVEAQREVYRDRIEVFRKLLGDLGVDAAEPEGGFYLWAPAPDGDAWRFTERLAVEGGCLVSPGDLYGAAGAGHVRVALVQPVQRLTLVAQRLAGS